MNNLKSSLAEVKKRMQKIAEHSFQDSLVGKVLDDTLDTNGKMIRATLLLLSSSFGPQQEKNKEKILTLAAMVELTHLASLIHDDIVDESDFRRGKPSIQSKYSKDAAVYAGDFLMARINYYEAKEKLNGSAEILSKAIEEMCSGEIGQAMFRYNADTEIEQYQENIKGKTVALFKAACLIGAKESGANKKVTETLGKIGTLLGYMFQLRDDLLDFTSDKYHLGKEGQKDFKEGIYTMPVLAARNYEMHDGKRKLYSLMKKNAKKALSETEISQAEQLVITQHGVEHTKEVIAEYSERIQALLLELPKTDGAKLLKQLVKNLEEK
ncbi:MAG: polyprenyl synthetase family protein [Bacillota bacterium]|nr:polyprenyl synthetase family protein [Bacillota bacterium]